MNFGEALEVLKSGGKVTRTGWNGKGQYLFLISYNGKTMNSYPMTDCIGMKTARDVIQTGWLASQTDMLMEDWEEVE